MKEQKNRRIGGDQGGNHEFDANQFSKSFMPPPFDLTALPSQQKSKDEPSLGSGDATSTYRKWSGNVFSPDSDNLDGPRVELNDIRQGGLGDCYFIATMAAVANTNPKVIEDMVKDNGDGTYDVSLHLYKGAFSFLIGTKVTIKVNAEFPSKGTDESPHLSYAKYNPMGERELWPMLIEKAYAQHLGGYDKIEGGNPGDAMEVITGNFTATLLTENSSEDELLSNINFAVQNGNPITGSVPDHKEDQAKQEELSVLGLYQKHAYVILSADMETKLIDLHNPWGTKHPPAITISDLKKYFYRIQINAK